MNKTKQTFLLLSIFGTLISCKNNDKDKPSIEPATEVTKQTNSYEQSDKYEEKIYEGFKINYSLNGNSLNVSLVTDLPDDIKISLSVSRSYWEKGDAENEYSEDYFSEYGTVGQWKNTQKINLKKQIWQNNLAANQRKMAESGLGFDVARVSDSIHVSAIVLLSNKPELIFKDGKIGDNEIAIYYPMDGKIKTQSKYGNSQSLKIGKTYSVSKSTPLMHEFNPSDPIEALKKTKELVVENKIKILSVENRNNEPWYKVKAFGQNNKSIGIGWINSSALIGQELKVIE